MTSGALKKSIYTIRVNIEGPEGVGYLDVYLEAEDQEHALESLGVELGEKYKYFALQLKGRKFFGME